MSMLSKGLRRTGLNKPLKFAAKAVYQVPRGLGRVARGDFKRGFDDIASGAGRAAFLLALPVAGSAIAGSGGAGSALGAVQGGASSALSGLKGAFTGGVGRIAGAGAGNPANWAATGGGEFALKGGGSALGGLARSAGAVGSWAGRNPGATALALQGAGQVAQAPAQARMARAQMRQADAQFAQTQAETERLRHMTEREREEEERKRRMAEALGPIWQSLAGQMQSGFNRPITPNPHARG
jgi:hypothetical protein